MGQGGSGSAPAQDHIGWEVGSTLRSTAMAAAVMFLVYERKPGHPKETHTGYEAKNPHGHDI